MEIEYHNTKNGIKINDNDKNCDLEWNMETNQEIWNSNIKKILLENQYIDYSYMTYDHQHFTKTRHGIIKI